MTSNLRRDDSGVAATEFALLLPLLLIMVMGVFEISRFSLLNQKLERLTFTVADVVTQQTALTNSQMADIVTASTKIMDPYAFGASGVVIISSIQQDAKKGPLVKWQYKGGGTLPKTSLIGAVGAVAKLPTGFTLNTDDNVIVAEIFYNYVPAFNEEYFSNRDNYKTAYFKPRFGALTTAPN